MNDTKTTIVSGLSEFKEEPKLHMGLLQQIKKATTKTELTNLLESAKSYTHVSKGTMRKWIKAATKRENEL